MKVSTQTFSHRAKGSIMNVKKFQDKEISNYFDLVFNKSKSYSSFHYFIYHETDVIVSHGHLIVFVFCQQDVRFPVPVCPRYQQSRLMLSCKRFSQRNKSPLAINIPVFDSFRWFCEPKMGGSFRIIIIRYDSARSDVFDNICQRETPTVNRTITNQGRNWTSVWQWPRYLSSVLKNIVDYIYHVDV